ncbi:MAG: CopG family antitoxin [Dehalococcoidia bacterium]|nr:CopG family antitoxin [Dehalococcoidia bacterium]
MQKNRTTISKAKSYEEISEFWDTHSLATYWEKTRPVDFEINITSEETYYPLDSSLLLEVGKAARQQGISPRKLMESWIKEKLEKTKA